MQNDMAFRRGCKLPFGHKIRVRDDVFSSLTLFLSIILYMGCTYLFYVLLGLKLLTQRLEKYFNQ